MCTPKHDNKYSIVSLFRTLFFVALIFIVSWCTRPVHALVLEDVRDNNQLTAVFANKKIGYYVGSFDPLHLGHEAFVHEITHKKLCDYVIVYPCWGGDSFKKRTDVQLRLEMLFAAFADHPHIIVTKLTPLALQQLLTIADDSDVVKSRFDDAAFVGIMGSDSVVSLHAYASALWAVNFMRGVKIPPHFAAHTNGATMALPVTSFIVALCKNDDASMLHDFVDDRPIIATIESPMTKNLSSTDIKIALRENKDMSGMLSKGVLGIIKKYGIYAEAC